MATPAGVDQPERPHGGRKRGQDLRQRHALRTHDKERVLPAGFEEQILHPEDSAQNQGQLTLVSEAGYGSDQSVHTPPSVYVLIEKLHQYLEPHKLKTGISLTKENFPDKPWLIIAVATVS